MSVAELPTGKPVSYPLRTTQKPQKKPYPQFLNFGTGPVRVPSRRVAAYATARTAIGSDLLILESLLILGAAHDLANHRADVSWVLYQCCMFAYVHM